MLWKALSKQLVGAVASQRPLGSVINGDYRRYQPN
jgi:hypothetical protein